MPPAAARSRMAREAASSHWSPKVIVPRQMRETCSPVRPRRVCRMGGTGSTIGHRMGRSAPPEDTIMANGSHVYIGAARLSGKVGGIFRRAVGTERWEQLTKGLPEKTNVHAITVHPTNPDTVFIGTHEGPYRSTDRGERWEKLAFPEKAEVWSIAVHPQNPRVMYAGTSPIGVFKKIG